MAGSVINRIRNMTIRRKLIAYAYLSVLLVFCVLSSILIPLAERNARDELINSAIELVSYANSLVGREQQYLYGIASYYAITAEVQKLLHSSNAGREAVELSSDLISVSQARKYVLGLAFYNIEGKAISYMSIDHSYGIKDQDPLDPDRPFAPLMDGKRTYLWEYIPQGDSRYLERDNSPKICLWHVIRDNITYQPIGVMAISLDTRKLIDAQMFSDDLYSLLLIADRDGEIIAGTQSAQNAFEATELSGLVGQTDRHLNTGHFLTELDGQSYYAVYGKVQGTDYITFMLIKNRMFFWNMQKFAVYSIGGIALSLLALLPIMIVVSGAYTHPLNKLLDSMQRYKDGDRTIRTNFKYSDEIGRLGNMFNEMVSENNRLIEETYLLTIRRQAAELATLQVQINPHFIYNMLNAIQWTAIDKNDHEIATMAYAMGQIFRLALNRGDNYSTIRQEQTLLRYYLDMQKRRFGDRVACTLEFDEDVLEVKIPKLLIQPLVENSIIHGRADSDSRINVAVRVRSVGGERIDISVEDDGVGISPEILRLLPDRLPADTASEESSRFALKNIADRLKLYYGTGAYTFEIFSEVGKGARILIRIPPEIKFGLQDVKGGEPLC